MLSFTAVRSRLKGSNVCVVGADAKGVETCFQEEGRNSLFRFLLLGCGRALHGARSGPHPSIVGDQP
jgi:hypothetical protein